MFWTKSHSSKHDKAAAYQETSRRVRAHQLHMAMNAEQAATAEKSTAHVESPNAQEGLDEGAVAQLGRQKQLAKEFVHGKSKQLRGMRARVRHGRRRARSRGRSLGF